MDMQEPSSMNKDADVGPKSPVHGSGPSNAKPKIPGGVTGKGFKPGQSGNPGGRSAIPEDIRITAMRFTGRALERITQLIESDDERVAFMASKELLDRVYGRTKTADDDDGKNGRVTINIVKLAGDEQQKPTGGQVITLSRFSDAS